MIQIENKMTPTEYTLVDHHVMQPPRCDGIVSCDVTSEKEKE